MSDRYQRDARLPFQEIQGQAVVVVPARRELHELDETATFLWRELAKARTTADLAAALCAEFEVEADVAEADVRAFVRSLEEKGLVHRA
ncbi:MAG: PqqD family protein [Planctomycetaceae bacterium]|nr:PqqD family protein [Planctomycetaceae bacterium]